MPNEKDPLVESFYKRSGLMVFSNGTTTDGKDFYAYVLMSTENYEKYLEATNSDTSYDLEDFGTIVMEGDTLEPSAEVKAAMKLSYGADQNFEENMTQIIEEKYITNFPEDIEQS